MQYYINLDDNYCFKCRTNVVISEINDKIETTYCISCKNKHSYSAIIDRSTLKSIKIKKSTFDFMKNL